MKESYDRRKFIKTSAVADMGLGVAGSILPLLGGFFATGKRVGIIGLDTSHSVEFTKELNSAGISSEFEGYRVVTPWGGLDIESSVKRIPDYIEDAKKMGVEIMDSITGFT